jgi:hypothetical protein
MDHESSGDHIHEQPHFLDHKVTKGILIYMGLQALLGFVLLEFAWRRTKRHREVDEERDSLFPHFRRTDVQNWARYKFYPGAMLLMPTRIILIVLICSLTIFICR